MSEPLLRIEDLCVGYGDFIAVNGASMQVGEGQIVSLIGLNGAGKTTLTSAVMGLQKPFSGKVFFGADDITAMHTDKIVSKGLTLIPQGGRCFNRMSVQDNLLMGSFPRSVRRDARERLERVYELFPVLKEKMRDPAGSLSGGQRQMVAIGRALMARPKCLIFDEISLGLSPAVIKDIYHRIRMINESDKTAIILIEQDTRRALKTSDSFFVMLKGRIVLSGKSAEVDEKTLKEAYFGI
ncbi:MAG: ABC transporter ATP-binding protein [Ruminococcus sp.]|nr:ABC transporter ATP-binding protein [Ruminococcus sp.]